MHTSRYWTYLEGLRERAARVAAGNRAAAEHRITAPADEMSELLQALWRFSVDGMVLTHRASHALVEVSDSFCALTGYARTELLGRTVSSLHLVEDTVMATMEALRAPDAHSGIYEARLRRKGGATCHVEFSHRLLGPDYVVTIVRDVTHRHDLEIELRRLADTDPLTGLLNRRRFKHEVDREIREAHRHGDLLSLIAIDVDGLKSLNDLHGHAVGDAALCKVAEAMAANIRDTDFAGRLGGDEFAVLVTRATHAGALRISDAIRSDLETKVIELETGPPLTVTVSVGIATHGASTSFAALLAEADTTMYVAKRAQRRRTRRSDAG